MPRLLPRLVSITDHQKSPVLFDLRKHRRRRPKSLHAPSYTNPSFDPDHYPQSILLQSVNPIATPEKYVRHKTLPPRIYVPKTARKREGENDAPREMTEEERKWWSSPYLRMLATPPRLCALSNRLLPSAFLLRLAPLRTENAELTSVKAPVPCILAPDGLQHPKYTAKRSNRSAHVVCSRQSISLILGNKKVGQIPHYTSISQNLGDHVAHLLRVRVLQELEILVSQLRAKPRADIMANPPIRRLTNAEWQNIEENRCIPWQDAVAVINLPLPISLKRGDHTRPSLSAFPLPSDPFMLENTPPVATIYPVSKKSSFPTNFQYRDVLPSAQVPLYDALGLFPHAAQRMGLQLFLSKAELWYEKTRECNGIPITSDKSNAYLLRSNSDIIKLADMPAVAMAMWRVYMYESNILKEC